MDLQGLAQLAEALKQSHSAEHKLMTSLGRLDGPIDRATFLPE